MRIIFGTKVETLENGDVKAELTLLPDDHENHDVRSVTPFTMILSPKLGQQIEDGHKTHADFGKGGPVVKA